MTERIPIELWVNIFNHLTPVDLCFSISPVNKLFFEISQDNQIWYKFKCDSWDDKSISSLPTIKRKYAVSEPSLQTLYKHLYIHWIREEGKKAKTKKANPAWVIAGKPKLDLLVTGNVEARFLLEPLIQNYIKNKPLVPSDKLKSSKAIKPFPRRRVQEEFNDVISNGVLLPFSNNTKTITLESQTLDNDSRMPLIYYLSSYTKSAHGIFWCIFSFSEAEKRYIEIIKKGLTENSPNLNHLMVLDYSTIGALTNPIPTANKVKESIKALGAEYIEPKDIGTALERMIKILEKDYFKIFPKYLPTLAEFQRFVFQPTLLKKKVTKNIHL